MNEWVAAIDPEKRDRVLNASIQEFASLPYEKASTNAIVQRAGISKGLLFHYFKSKKDLYEKLIGFVIHTLYKEISAKINWEEPDLFERLRQIALIKMEISRAYPHMFDFLFQVIACKNSSDVAGIMELYKGYGLDIQQISQEIYTKNIDYSRFRHADRIPETVNIVRWTLEKYGEEQLKILAQDANFHFPEAAENMNHYMEILKEAFYR